jgi:2-polyprenyl-3-methyl-5-hydroxy-6-metoxy-1,4-benzoquinol methylase
MLSVLERRARKAGLLGRIELRRIEADNFGIDDLSGEVDFAVALHVVHEVPNQSSFFTEVWKVLKHDSKLLVVEPKGHVSGDQFEESMASAQKIGFKPEPLSTKISGRVALLGKPDN